MTSTDQPAPILTDDASGNTSVRVIVIALSVAHNGTYGRSLSSGLAAHIAGYGRLELVIRESCSCSFLDAYGCIRRNDQTGEALMRIRLFVAIVMALSLTAALALASPAASAPVEGDSYGLVDPASGQWHLSQEGQSAVPFYFGNPGDYPFMGDWDCDGVDTPGLYRQSDGYAYLRNSNTQGIANVSFFFGDPGDIPVAGDFNADGCDTLSIYRPSNQTFYIINMLGTDDGGLGAAEYSFVFGNFGDKPFIGDFNGNGQDTVGLHRESTGLVYYRNTNTQGNADNQFIFGDPGDRLIAGDWNSNGTDSPGLFRPSNTTVYLRYENSQGNADESHMAGAPGWLPVARQLGVLTVPPPPEPTHRARPSERTPQYQ